MAACPKCGADIVGQDNICAACGPVATAQRHGFVNAIFAHIPHPHVAHRKLHRPKPVESPRKGAIGRFNTFVGVRITDAVGTMWCAYLFAALALVSLPEAIKGGTAMLVAWIAQTFIQLVLLSIIMVGQKIAGEATDKRAIDTYNDAEAVLHEALQIQQHLAAQDALLQRLIAELCERTAAAAAAPKMAGNDAPPASID